MQPNHRLPTTGSHHVGSLAILTTFALSTSLALPRCVGASPADTEIRVGMAGVEITPPVGFPIAGYFHERLATDTLDPLMAKAIVLRDAGEQAALVVCDLGAIAVDLARIVRERAGERTGIPAANIVVAATHSHTGPDYFKDLYLHLAKRQTDRRRAAYIEKLIRGPVEAIARAHAAAEPVVLEAGDALQTTPVAFNRRFVVRDGSARTWMSLASPEVVRAAGPIDPEIGLLLVRSRDGETARGVLSNFALHLDTVGGLKWSGDFPYFIERSLREALGSGLISLFSQGCCGDINHVDPAGKPRNKTDFIGESLGATIVSHVGKLERLERTTLRVRSRTVPLPIQDVSRDEISSALETLAAIRRKETVDFLDHVAARQCILRSHLRQGPDRVTSDRHLSWGLTHTWSGVGDTLPTEVHAICVGDELAIVCLPGEVFVDLGLAIKRASPFRTTLVVELAGCAETNYIPTRAAYAQGSYEVTNSTVKPGAGEMLVEAAVGLMRDAAAAAVASSPRRK